MPEITRDDIVFHWIDRLHENRDEPDVHLRMHCTNVFVSDLERSRHFYVQQLGFEVAYEAGLPSGERWLAVAPPDGTAFLALVLPAEGGADRRFIGRERLVAFGTTDVAAKHDEWKAKGVRFLEGPTPGSWGGLMARFADPDGNTFTLVSHQMMTSALEEERIRKAKKMQAERELRQQIEIARQIQMRLFPQEPPPMSGLAYGGMCLPALTVGGDYYDFLVLDSCRLAFVLGDIAGKGIGAALLMAHLQASVRGQLALAREAPDRFLAHVNHLFRASTADNAYATLLYLEYESGSGSVRYANCGHPAPIVVTPSGEVRRLGPTATVVGLFERWQTTVGEASLSPGDVLALFSDGVIEQVNHSDEEFGEERLVDLMLRLRREPVEALLQSILAELRLFGGGGQNDDITLIVAKRM